VPHPPFLVGDKMNGIVEKMPVRDGKPRDFTFVKGEDGKTYFLHITDWKTTHWKMLAEGNFPKKVIFDSETTDKGQLRAKNAKFIIEEN
jgi:cold shock CspA family protein